MCEKPEPIMPTIGRVMWYWPNGRGEIQGKPVHQVRTDRPFIAWVCYPHSLGLVNLVVADHAGNRHVAKRVYVRQPGTEPPSTDVPYVEWMPYQIKKQHGSESGEQAAGTEQVDADSQAG